MSSQASAQLPRPGDMIAGKYVLDRLLGQGGMGAVFAARHLKLSKAVAIKIMLADASNPEASQRFINEGRAAANIQNEHVVRVDDVDEESGYAYMVLELLEGRDLAQILEASPIKRVPPNQAVRWVVEGLRGVSQAHALGIVHRDLKPSNLFLAKRKDGTEVVKVLDFGISKATGANALGAAPSSLTSTKAMLGSPLYMSPEQLRNAKSVDHRADIWAMGIILYELITGQLPFMGDSLGELFAAILESDALPLSERIGAGILPPGLNEVVLRCLARKPEQRFQSAMELAQALAPFEHGTAGAQGTGARTAFMPQNLPQNAPITGPQPMVSTNGGHAQGQAASMANQAMPMPTGSNPALPAGFNQTTGSGWQTQGAAGVPKSNKAVFLALGLFAFVAVVGGGAGIYAVTHRASDTTAKQPPPPASSTLPVAGPAADPIPTQVKTPEPPASSAAEPPVSAAPSAPPAPAPAPVPAPIHHPPPPAPGPSLVAKPLPPAPAPTPAPKPTSNLENSR